MKTYRAFREAGLDDKLDKYVSDEIKKRKLAKFPVNATDDYKMKKGKPAFTFPSPTGSMVIHVWLRPMAKPAITQIEPYRVIIAEKKYHWCCARGLSDKQPFCDSVHFKL